MLMVIHWAIVTAVHLVQLMARSLACWLVPDLEIGTARHWVPRLVPY
jgi:hypothetical protein